MSYLFLSRTEHVARKKHRCIWCGEQVLPGTRYVRQAGVFEGDLQADKWHLECNAAGDEYFSETGEETFDPHQNERPPALQAHG